jgi:hypothetical protein
MKFLLLILFTVLITSCDCFVKLEGSIVDRTTGKSIEGATYKNLSKNWISKTTDSSGHFNLSAITDQHCTLTILVEKEGYKSLDSALENGSHVLRLIPLK